MTDQPVRHTADTITDNDLDELYARIATLEAVAASNKRHVQLIVPDLENALTRAEQAEAAITRVREYCDGLDTGIQRLTHNPAAVHPVAANLRHFLDQPQEPAR